MAMFTNLSVRACLIALALPLLSGCIGTQLKFKTVVERTGQGPSGWQEACLEALFENMTTQDKHVCLVGIGMPMETRTEGYISPWDAGEIAAECINEASNRVVKPAPPSVPSALACSTFKDELSRILNERIYGSRVKLGCTVGIPHTRVGF
jgi:hypothetical protein